jgi:hypothetical protein
LKLKPPMMDYLIIDYRSVKLYLSYYFLNSWFCK